MKTAFSYNLLKHLRSKKAEGGFTLIELLVVIIIIGILAAIALPAFLNQANRARESEAANYVGAANRGQQAYYLEELAFAPETSDMEVGIETTTDNFVYGELVDGSSPGTFLESNAAAPQNAIIYGSPRAASLKGFSGMVYNNPDNSQTVLLCREEAATDTNATAIVPATAGAAAAAGNEPCPADTESL